MSSLISGRTNSFSSSISSRAPSVLSRNTSNGSFASSMGPGGRPATSYGSRPQSSMAFSQSTTTRPVSGLPKSRPATAMENHSSDEDIPAQGKRKGMQRSPSVLSSTPSPQGYSSLQNKKLRAPQTSQLLKSSNSVSNKREVSVSTAMSRLRIVEERQPSQQPVHQVIPMTMKPPSTKSLSHKHSISTGMRALRINSSESALVLFQASGDSLVAPKTPSQIPVLSKMGAVAAAPVTPCRIPRSSPSKPPFLTKDSNILGFIAWDVHGRLEDMEAMYSELKNTLSGTSLERNTLEEAQALYKAKSKPCLQINYGRISC